jgi:multiple sugar transport system permease protein
MTSHYDRENGEATMRAQHNRAPQRLCLVLLVSLLALPAPAPATEITIRMMAGPSWGMPPKEATDPRSVARRAVFEEFHRRHPGIRVVNAGGLDIAGPRAESMFLMSMAGDTAPDVFYVNFRQYYNYIDQGFCRPLDDLIARDPHVISRVHDVVMRVLRSFDGKIYALPWSQFAQGLYYRKDHFAEAGLDPARPPTTWAEFYDFAKRLTESRPGRVGFAFSSGPAYHWSNFAWQAGAEIVTPGRDGLWKAAINTPQGATALEFYRKLVTDTWRGKDGKMHGPAAITTLDWQREIREGRVSMWFAYTADVVLNLSDLNPSLLGVAALPAGPAGRANEVNAGMWAINASIRDPAKLEACWTFLKFFAGDEAAEVTTRQYVELGLGALVNPTWLKKFGYADLAAQVDPAFVRANEEVFATGHPEPYGRNCQQVYVVLDSALERAALYRKEPALRILDQTAAEMDRKLLGYTSAEVLAQQRTYAWIVFAFLITCVAAFGMVALVRFKRKLQSAEAGRSLGAGQNLRRIHRFIAICLLPAAASLIVWSYYPLLRGLIIAFQDYRIMQPAKWVGLDNFIAVFTQPIFYRALANTFAYVALSILIGFFLPMILALALNEIPRFKILFRTVFYLPAMTSGIVIAILWRQFYDKSETGLLNSILRPFIEVLNPVLETIHMQPIALAHDWLGNPTLALFAVVLPGIWAGAGPGSILYLAALKNIPDERYEAADLDGASWFHKVLYITMPALKPLILINLLGVFIAGFKAMENIFVLTGGGPLYATHTIGLEVWTNAFMFLKFGYATAAAWVMGAILIGFTVLQLRTLLQLRFTTSKL